MEKIFNQKNFNNFVGPTPAANLLPVSMTPVANLPPVPLISLIPVANNGNSIRLPTP
jgi:hypothetical protein